MLCLNIIRRGLCCTNTLEALCSRTFAIGRLIENVLGSKGFSRFMQQSLRRVLPYISVAFTFNLVACGNDRTVQPPYHPPNYPQSQPQTSTNYSQRERELADNIASHRRLCTEYTEKVQSSFQDGQNPGAHLVGMRDFHCLATSAYESELMQLQLQRQAGQ
ncbi:hypothetical protein OsccyDRAFT_3534 [Leptolyngbyaceae cyanobacterium JSC-12]|nr:hypothetical protein OsccyDRAFT_3534 [Leptolyngbyaceae cyanobacterium JSC-12]